MSAALFLEGRGDEDEVKAKLVYNLRDPFSIKTVAPMMEYPWNGGGKSSLGRITPPDSLS
jgi:hypothetical protein